MHVGISVPLPAYLVDVGFMARKAEDLGFESFFCAEHPFTITVHGQPADRDLIRRLHDAGANQVLVRPPTVKTEAEMGTELTRIADAVLR